MCVSLSSSCWQHVLVLGSRGRAATLATLPPHSLAQPPSFDAIVSRLFSSPRRTMTTKWCGLRPPAPRDHPPAFVRYRLPRAPETWTPFTCGCMTSEPHSTRFERAPGAFSEFSGCSGLVGRTVLRVMMAHLKFACLSRSVRAVWDEFGATVRGLFRLVILFFDRR